jgi:hypothetical protein
MLGSRHHQGGLIHRTRLGKLQTDETQTGRKVRREHLGCFAHGFGYTVFKEITRVAGASVVRVAALLRRGGLGIVGENARRYESAILRRRQPEGQKDNCNDATGERHAPLSTLIGPILSITECPHLKRGMPVKTYFGQLGYGAIVADSATTRFLDQRVKRPALWTPHLITPVVSVKFSKSGSVVW